jgi:hypothetical protein
MTYRQVKFWPSGVNASHVQAQVRIRSLGVRQRVSGEFLCALSDAANLQNVFATSSFPTQEKVIFEIGISYRLSAISYSDTSLAEQRYFRNSG